jgi:hypothetical protein
MFYSYHANELTQVLLCKFWNWVLFLEPGSRTCTYLLPTGEEAVGIGRPVKNSTRCSSILVTKCMLMHFQGYMHTYLDCTATHAAWPDWAKFRQLGKIIPNWSVYMRTKLLKHFYKNYPYLYKDLVFIHFTKSFKQNFFPKQSCILFISFRLFLCCNSGHTERKLNTQLVTAPFNQGLARFYLCQRAMFSFVSIESNVWWYFFQVCVLPISAYTGYKLRIQTNLHYVCKE